MKKRGRYIQEQAVNTYSHVLLLGAWRKIRKLLTKKLEIKAWNGKGISLCCCFLLVVAWMLRWDRSEEMKTMEISKMARKFFSVLILRKAMAEWKEFIKFCRVQKMKARAADEYFASIRIKNIFKDMVRTLTRIELL